LVTSSNLVVTICLQLSAGWAKEPRDIPKGVSLDCFSGRDEDGVVYRSPIKHFLRSGQTAGQSPAPTLGHQNCLSGFAEYRRSNRHTLRIADLTQAAAERSNSQRRQGALCAHGAVTQKEPARDIHYRGARASGSAANGRCNIATRVF
jgi:hypothetical protein